MTYPAVSVEKKPRTGRYRVSTGADSGYGETIDVFDDVQDAMECAQEHGEEVYPTDSVESDAAINS